MQNVTLFLANGQTFSAQAHNHDVNQIIRGELVFNTGMTGYAETLTDPSYSGQILVFTYPLIGNYGVGATELLESEAIHVKAVICNTIIENQSHHESQLTFLAWLKQHNVPVLTDIDTRELTKVLRENGSMECSISRSLADNFSNKSCVEVSVPRLKPLISCAEPKYHGSGTYKIILLDCGVKQSIIRFLLDFDVTIKQVPYDYDYTHEDYDGLLLSNGPGDPQDYTDSIKILQKALNLNKPIFGICLGSQLLGLASGATTYKLKFGHRGQNQPCQNQQTQKCYLTAQNHSFAISAASLADDWEISFKHLYDDSIAGIRHKTKPFSAVQFHPEAAAGPLDTKFLFKDFFNQVMSWKKACI